MAESDDSFEDTLFNKGSTESTYSKNGKYQAHLLDQYKLYVEMTDRISSRRQSANSYFLAINTALIGFVVHATTKDANSHLWLIPVAGIAISFLWYRLIVSYRDLNTAKFKIIHAIEKRLPLSLYGAEWEAVGFGESPKSYLPFTHVETGVPWIFILSHVVLFYRAFSWNA